MRDELAILGPQIDAKEKVGILTHVQYYPH